MFPTLLGFSRAVRGKTVVHLNEIPQISGHAFHVLTASLVSFFLPSCFLPSSFFSHFFKILWKLGRKQMKLIVQMFTEVKVDPSILPEGLLLQRKVRVSSSNKVCSTSILVVFTDDISFLPLPLLIANSKMPLISYRCGFFVSLLYYLHFWNKFCCFLEIVLLEVKCLFVLIRGLLYFISVCC